MRKTTRFLLSAIFLIVAFCATYCALKKNILGFRDFIFSIYSTVSDVTQEKPDKLLHGPYKVVRAIDGDTAIISIDRVDTRVRFIGIDTPESVNPNESKNTPEGNIASNRTKILLTGKSVYLEYDVQQKDDYDRTLAYVYLIDKTTMVQIMLLEEGLATTMTIQPNSKYSSIFYETMKTAREKAVGFWGTGFFHP